MCGIFGTQSAHLVESGHRCRQSAPALHGVAAVAFQHSYAQSARILMFVHEADTLFQGVFSNNSVWVQQQHVFALCAPYAHVVGFCKAMIVIAGNKLHTAVLAFKLLHGVVF